MRHTALLLLALVGCPAGPDPRIADPCYSPTLHVDTLTLVVDSVTWKWTPGECS